ncbi:unnamed protein product [Heligmosomoides polygyrus]|uniref:C-type lectin domain-containing protein n=1 Tax=Heligmosomoides polygyrus TaxID=6339 RepID=A0A183G4E5_HELPZ|nr:unnamed protein product [Heligmosomoides polygyrus]
MGHNNDSTVPHDYRYYIDQVECLNNTKCALFIWRTTGNTWFTIASSDCITSEHECKEVRSFLVSV